MLPFLATLLLWTGVVILYDALWWRREDTSRTRSIRVAFGSLLSLAGFVCALVSATSTAAGISAAILHLTAALTLVAVVAPLLKRPQWAMIGATVSGLLVAIVEGLS